MKQYITLVLEYPNEDAAREARVGFNTTLLGGRVVAMQFDDALEVIEKLEDKIETLEEAAS